MCLQAWSDETDGEVRGRTSVRSAITYSLQRTHTSRQFDKNIMKEPKEQPPLIEYSTTLIEKKRKENQQQRNDAQAKI